MWGHGKKPAEGAGWLAACYCLLLCQSASDRGDKILDGQATTRHDNQLQEEHSPSQEPCHLAADNLLRCLLLLSRSSTLLRPWPCFVQKILDFATVVFLFLFDKYYLIIN